MKIKKAFLTLILSAMAAASGAAPSPWSFPVLGGTFDQAKSLGMEPFPTDASAYGMPSFVDYGSQQERDALSSALGYGRYAIIGLNRYMGLKHDLLPDAADRFFAALSQSPGVYHSDKLLIDVIDEPFWYQGSADPSIPEAKEHRRKELELAKSGIAFLRGWLPNAKLGVVFTPASLWSDKLGGFDEAALKDAYELASGLDWVGFDPYFWQAQPGQAELAARQAKEFLRLARSSSPSMKLALVIQGFGVPSDWSRSNPAAWEAAHAKGVAMSFEAADGFDGVLVFGFGLSQVMGPGCKEPCEAHLTPGEALPKSLSSIYSMEAAAYMARKAAQNR